MFIGIAPRSGVAGQRGNQPSKKRRFGKAQAAQAALADTRAMCHRIDVRRVDDYQAKYALWASRPRVHRLPGFTGVPRFGVRRFGSYEELNVWKRELLREIARRGGLTWTN